MEKKTPKLVVGFVTYGESTAKYLPYFLDSLKKQTFKDSDVLVVDNSPQVDNPNLEYLKNHSFIEVIASGENRGFARAYNILIKEAAKRGAEYFLTLNPDMLLEPEAIEGLVTTMDNDKSLGSAAPKILKWDFKNNAKTSILDTCGIKIKKNLTFFDTGQAEEDQGLFDNKEMLGPSGAAGIYRMSALEEVKEGENYFDEMMFMYKEDCDLAYRMRLAGYRSICVGGSVFYHDRTASGKGEGILKVALNRKKKSRQVKKWSFFNQQIIFIKYWNIQTWPRKMAILWYQLKALVFILLFEQYLLKEWWQIWKAKDRINKY